MKINLHNKFEVTTGGKTFVAYNTMLKSVFEKIAGLSFCWLVCLHNA